MHRIDEDTVEYVSITELFPAQIRYSVLNMQEKANKRVVTADAVWTDDGWRYKHDSGRSVLSRRQALPVVKASFGYVLIDGHHDVLSSMKLQAKTVPITVIEDVSDLSPEEFWEEADERGWSYLYSVTGEKIDPPASFADLVDDPNRYFAALVARKFKLNADGSYISKGAEYPLWVKIDKDIPFIEFKISNALYDAGFVYSPEHMGNPPAESVVERARKILADADIDGLRVVPYRIHHEKFRPRDDYVRIKVPGPDIVLRKALNDDKAQRKAKRLQEYVNKVESHRLADGTTDFAYGFTLFKGLRSHIRENKYQRAKNVLIRLQPVPR